MPLAVAESIVAQPAQDENVVIPSSGSSLAADSVRTFLARSFITIMSITTGVLVAKFLGPAGKGVFSGAFLLLSLVMVVPAGIGSAVTYALAKQRRPLHQLVPALCIVFVAITVLSIAGAGVWAWLRHWNLALLFFVAAVPASTILAWQGGLYVGLGRLRNLNIQSAMLAIATLAAVALSLTLLHAGIKGVLIAWVLCLYGAAATVVWHVARLTRWGGRAALAETLRNLLHFGGQSSLNMLLGSLNYRIDSIILIAMLGAAPFGIYSIAVNVGEALFWISRPIATAISRDIGARGLDSSAAMTAKVIRISTATIALVALLAELIGPWTIDVIFGTRFRDAGTPLRILLPGIVVFATAGIFAAFFLLQLGKPAIVAAVNLAMIGIQSVACYLLVPHFGSSGAAAASTATYILGAILNTWWFCRATRMRFADVWILKPGDIQTVRLAADQILASYRRPRGSQQPSPQHLT